MAKNEVMIPVFDGEEYSMWKKRITMFLKMGKCETVIERPKSTTDSDDWDENDLKAINYIYSAVTNKQLELVCDKTTAYEIMNKFDKIYLKASTVLQILCRKDRKSVV